MSQITGENFNDEVMEHHFFVPEWKIRRRIIILTLLFCSGSILYLMINGNECGLHESIANGLILLSGSVIGSYIFGAVWCDKYNR